MKINSLTKWLSVLTIIATGIFFIITDLGCNSGAKKVQTSAKSLILWTVGSTSEIPPDSISYDGRWGFSVIACQGEYESAQVAICSEDKKLTIHAEATELLQTLGPGKFDMTNIELRMIEYLPDGIEETLIPLPGSFVLEPNRTQVLRLTVFVPKGTEPTGYHQGVIKLNTGTEEVNIGMLVRVKDIEKAKILPVDLSNTIIVKASVAPTTPADYAYSTEGRFCFHFNLQWTPEGKVKAGDYLRFTFRNIFTNELTYYKYLIKKPLSSEAHVILTAKDVNLKASSYHVRVDIMRGNQSLSPIAPGACQVYVAREGESAGHVFASFVVSRLAYMWDEKQGIYYHLLPGNLSPSGDPFTPVARPVYEQALRMEINRMGYYDWTGRHPMENVVPEAQHDGGVGILYSAAAFRKIGETDRALFCEQAVKRIVNAVLARKVDTIENGQPGIFFYAPRQQQTLLLKLLCDACLYFRDVVGDKEYAEKLYEPIKLIGGYQMAQSNTPLGISEGKVYDGRILVGISNYCLTEKAIFGEFNKKHVVKVFDLATRMSEHTLLHNGWYDDGGLKSHDGYGTMNVLWGLLEARKLALATEEDEQAKLYKKAIFTAFDFLASINSSITGYTPQWIPSRHGSWSAGDTYKMMNEMERQFGENKNVQWFRSHICDRNITYTRKLISGYNETSSLGSKNTLPAYLMECEEYKKAVK